jgi:hypothetical protein
MDWSEPLINIEHLAIELKDTLNENNHHDAESVVRDMLNELMNLHAALLIAQWVDEKKEEEDRIKLNPSPVPRA